MDPGILPRGEDETAQPTVIPEVTLADGSVIKLRWCYTCKIWKPPRSSHCPYCDNCVLAFDHHCPVLGTCIGARNIKYFLLLLVFGYALLLYVIIVTSIVFATQTGTTQILAIIFVVVLGAGFSAPLTAFLGFHFFTLFLNGMTTREYIKGSDEETGERPVFSCPKSQIHLREFVGSNNKSLHMTARDPKPEQESLAHSEQNN
eukprot:c17087_g1_i3.p1 GENE.c17087_g1_i3~~c17087_g1_i3.p1  ORF type:complete len:203 (+),score=34.50 c17087_g1_i3:322-930(+)